MLAEPRHYSRHFDKIKTDADVSGAAERIAWEKYEVYSATLRKRRAEWPSFLTK
jgi:hypothetical protein